MTGANHTLGNIGEDQGEIVFEPLEHPADTPLEIPPLVPAAPAPELVPAGA